MEGIKPAERVLFNQVSGKMENFVMHLNNQIGRPFALKQLADLFVSNWNEVPFTHPACESCIHFWVSNLGCSDDAVFSKYVAHLFRSRFPNVALNQCARVQIDHRRPSITVAEMGCPEILIKGIFDRNFFRGSRILPCPASSVNFASNEVAGRLPSVGRMTAIGFPRSVIKTSSPFLVRLRYWVSRFLSSLTPTIFISCP